MNNSKALHFTSSDNAQSIQYYDEKGFIIQQKLFNNVLDLHKHMIIYIIITNMDDALSIKKSILYKNEKVFKI